MTHDFDDIEFSPPTAERVAARALVLAAMVFRSSLEASTDDPEAEAARDDLVAWLASAGIGAELEDHERAFIGASLGSLDRQSTINASWRGEAMAVLAWALGRAALPPYDTIVDSPTIADQLGFLGDSANSIMASSALRPADEIDHFREKMFALHWRLREFSLTREPVDFRRIARTASSGPLDISTLHFVGNDLAIDGRPLMDISEQRWRECLGVASESHRAANWLAGYESRYSDVTADT
jgi:hypothetical protein